MEKTFVMVKPDGVRRGLVGEVIRRFEARGLRLAALKMLRISRELAQEHYQVHKDKPFFRELVDFITSGPVVAMVLEGRGAVGVVRSMMGATDPVNAAPGTIRGDYALELTANVVHGSDSVETAEREMSLFFSAEEFGAGTS